MLYSVWPETNAWAQKVDKKVFTQVTDQESLRVIFPLYQLSLSEVCEKAMRTESIIFVYKHKL